MEKNGENHEEHGCDIMQVLGQFKVENDVNLVEASGVKMSSRSAHSSISLADRGVLSIILRELSVRAGRGVHVHACHQHQGAQCEQR